jgi:two-component system chemotaxis sensor kinase CheA
MSDYLDPNNEELLKDFFSEAEMHVEALEQNILVLEHDTANADAIDEIFRAAHTLKGAAATVQMAELTGFTHALEDLLDDIRSGKIKSSGDIIDILLEAIDVIKAMLGARADGTVYGEDISDLKHRLEALQGGSNAAVPTSKKIPTAKASTIPPPIAVKTASLSEYEQLELKEAADGIPVYEIRVHFDRDNPMNSVGGIQVFAALKDLGSVLKTVPDFDALYQDVYHPEVVYYLASNKEITAMQKAVKISDVTTGSEVSVIHDPDKPVATPKLGLPIPLKPADATRSDVETAESPEEETEAPETKQPAEARKHAAVGGSILRVESKRIDELLNLVSETVINKATFNQVSNLFSEILNSFQTAQAESRQNLKQLFDGLPALLELIQKNGQIKDIKKEIIDRFSNVATPYDPLVTALKTTVGKFRNTAQNLGRITSELQEGVMRIRMVPISQIFSRFPRLVRDLSKQLGKEINLNIEGEDTELDKSVIEDLLDPMIHCVRNAIDHGVESPEVRKKQGKAEAGEVLLKASNEGNMILIEISDDGRGIDVEAVRKKGIERGIIHPNKSLSDVEAFNLIFDAGFSTAQTVTDISGRGVGLDVVKKQIEKLNGSVNVTSERGHGTKFIIKIPLTLAIIQGLLVRVGTETYAIPITAVLDSHRIKPTEIRLIDNYEVFNVRDDVISLMRLSRLFRIPTDEHKDHYFVVIVGSGEKKMGLIVDALVGEEDVVIKPLRDHYTNAPGIAGANITGNGTVSLIIDVSQLLELGQNREIEARHQRELAYK